MKKLLLLLIIFITGCMQYNDLSKLTVIKSVGVSFDEKYLVYAQIIDDIDEDNKPIMKTIKANGKTIQESFNNLKDNINKDTSLSHVDLLVLNDDLQSNNYQDIITYFIKSNDFRNDFYCVFSPDVKALLEKSTYDEIEIFLKSNEHKDKIIIKNFDNVITEFIDNNKVTLPRITYQDKIIFLGNMETNYEEKD